MGLAFVVLSVGGLVGNPIDGALLTSSFNWERPIFFSAVCFFVGRNWFDRQQSIASPKKGDLEGLKDRRE